jgi:hypothetical protein
MESGIFQYKLLEKFLNSSYKKNKPKIFNLLISLDKSYYEKEFFNLLLKSFKDLILKYKIPVYKIRFDVGDILNRHNIYYKYILEYIKKNNLNSFNQISKKISDDFYKKAYNYGKKQGEKWLKNNVEAINQLIPDRYKLSKDFKIGNGITTLYKGDKNNPAVEYICYEHWLKHPKYKTIKKTLQKICEEKNHPFKRAIQYEAEYFYERMSKKEKISDKEFFLQQTKNYIFDETIPVIIKNSSQFNLIEFYYGGRDLLTSLYFKGRKAQNNPEIKKLMEEGQPLEGADQRKFVSVKMVEEENKNSDK